MSQPDPNTMTQFCRAVVPEMLSAACGVEPIHARGIGDNILDRAQAFAALERTDQRTITAPFVEDVLAYHPIDAPVELKAAIAVVVRNSQLEEAHAHGPVNSGGIQALTTAAAAPLSHLLAAPRRDTDPSREPNPFSGLRAAYPRAWSALSALSTALESGGRVGYNAPDAAIPPLPGTDESVPVQPSAHVKDAVVQSGIDPVLNDHLVGMLRLARSEQVPFYTPSLSRLSRDSLTLHYVVEFLLSHKVPIATTNCLIRPSDVWVRTGALVPTDTQNVRAGLDDLNGLTGSHRKTVEMIRRTYPG